jgi:hypothetical protein
MIETLKGFPENVLGFVCHEQVTKDDYDTVLIPAVEQALKDHDKLRLYYETAPDLTGIDASAMWEDTKVGISHFTRWEKFAVVTDIEWISRTMKFFSFLMPGEMRVFKADEAEAAKQWIVA